MAKPNISIRLDAELVELAKKDGINLSSLTETAIKKALKLKCCPYCGAKKRKDVK